MRVDTVLPVYALADLPVSAEPRLHAVDDDQGHGAEFRLFVREGALLFEQALAFLQIPTHGSLPLHPHDGLLSLRVWQCLLLLPPALIARQLGREGVQFLHGVGVPALVAAFASARPHALPAHLHGPEATRETLGHLAGSHCPEVFVRQELGLKLLVQHELRLRVLHQGGRLLYLFGSPLHVLLLVSQGRSLLYLELRLWLLLPTHGRGHHHKLLLLLLAAHSDGHHR
mmetsp:Transcript_90624/g.252022  ORF Transcript_90624/g.252022 Transcript_90624/m.252022 type:complete len:228 (-) Transcript_90624:51-734(-)